MIFSTIMSCLLFIINTIISGDESLEKLHKVNKSITNCSRMQRLVDKHWNIKEIKIFRCYLKKNLIIKNGNEELQITIVIRLVLPIINSKAYIIIAWFFTVVYCVIVLVCLIKGLHHYYIPLFRLLIANSHYRRLLWVKVSVKGTNLVTLDYIIKL